MLTPKDQDLIQKYLDGTLTESEAAELETRKTDPEFTDALATQAKMIENLKAMDRDHLLTEMKTWNTGAPLEEQISNSKSQNPKPGTQIPNDKSQNPEPETDKFAETPLENTQSADDVQASVGTQNPKPDSEHLKPKTRNRLPAWWMAIPLALIIAYFIFRPVPDTQNRTPETQNQAPVTDFNAPDEIYAAYFKPVPVSEVTRGSDELQIQGLQALDYYRQGNYEAAYPIFAELVQDSALANTRYMLYAAISAMEIGDTQTAHAHFEDSMRYNDLNSRMMSTWYFALNFIKKEQISTARMFLQQITSGSRDHIFYKQAVELDQVLENYQNK